VELCFPVAFKCCFSQLRVVVVVMMWLVLLGAQDVVVAKVRLCKGLALHLRPMTMEASARMQVR
jgi:hypothetical protein